MSSTAARLQAARRLLDDLQGGASSAGASAGRPGDAGSAPVPASRESGGAPDVRPVHRTVLQPDPCVDAVADGGLEQLVKDLSARGLRSLAVRDYTRHELRGRLSSWVRRRREVAALASAVDTDVRDEPRRKGRARATPTMPVLDDDQAGIAIERALDALTRQGWLDQQRAVAARLQSGRQRYGSRRVVADLRRAGAEAGAAEIERLRSEDEALARRLLQRRYGDAPPSDVRERARRLRFLIGRGIPSSLAGRLVAGRGDDVAVAEDDRAGPQS